MPDSRVERLLDAVLAITADVDLEGVLRHVVEAACALVGARYGALGVVGDDGELSAFVHTGLDTGTVEKIGALPRGEGVLGALLEDPETLRLERLADHPRSVGFPPHHPPMHGFLGTPIRVRNEVYGNLYLTEKIDGGTFTQDDEDLVEGLAAVAGAAIANARLVEGLQRRDAWRDAVLELAVEFVAGAPIGVARRRVAEVGRRLLDGDGAAIVIVDEDDRSMVVASVGEGPEPGAVPPEAPVHHTLARQEAIHATGAPLFDGRAVAWAPLRDEAEGTVGALGVGREEPFGAEDLELLESFTAQASLALAHQRTAAELQRLQLLEDRERIGRDLHDTVIQQLFATGLSLQALTRRVEDTPVVAERLARAVDDIDATVKQIRSTIFGLQARGTPASVRAAILDVIDEVGALLDHPPRVRFHGAVDTVIGEVVADHLTPVVRETLTNVAKHARATHVEVELTIDGGDVVVRVRDDGVGGVERHRPGGLGLGNLHDRAETCGGSLTIHSPPGGGTEVLWRVPVEGQV